jgi:Polymerase beta, Nucleotidyltransferase
MVRAQQPSIQQQFTAALDSLVEQVKKDRSILAAILCGSLSHDTVWTKSDIDLVLVTTDDKRPDATRDFGVALYADGMNVHAILLSRTKFRQTVEGAIRNSFTHSFLTKGRLLYTHDPTIADLCASLSHIGARDRDIQLLRAGSYALAMIDKAHKWFVTRGDLDYSALWILYAATALAQVEVISAGLLADREVIPQAMSLNPAFFKIIYTDLLNTKKTRKNVKDALDAIDDYVAARAPSLFAAVIDHLREAGEVRSCSELDHHFKRNFDVADVTTACEYLAHRGLIVKASTPVRLTKRSTCEVQELAFFYSESAARGVDRKYE